MADAPQQPLEYMRLYTDGACKGNPGPGGWAFILQHPASAIRVPGLHDGPALQKIADGLHRLQGRAALIVPQVKEDAFLSFLIQAPQVGQHVRRTALLAGVKPGQADVPYSGLARPAFQHPRHGP